MEDKVPFQEVKFYKKLQSYFDINEEIRRFTDEVFQKNTISHSNKPLKGVAIFFFTKAIKTNAAIWHLCADGYGEDAAILVRSLFNLVVNYYFILSQDSGNRAIEFIEHHKITRKQIHDVIKKWPDKFSDVKIANNKEKEIQQEAVEVVERYKFDPRKPWSRKSILAMSKDIDAHSEPNNHSFEQNYDILYTYLSDFEHSNVMSSGSYLSEDSNGWIANVNPSEELVQENLATSAGLLLMIAEKFYNIFELKYEKELQDFLERLEKLGKPLLAAKENLRP